MVVSSVSYPAQGDFSIESQSRLYELFKKDTEKITINQYSQLSPIKTVMLVYGIGDKENGKNMCEECESPCSNLKFTGN